MPNLRSETYRLQWISDVKKSDDKGRIEAGSFIAYEPMRALDNGTSSKTRAALPSQDMLRRWCNDIFRSGFETTFGLLAGTHGCPFMYASEMK
jgi:hypothetical protein